ncbi:MAG: HNH endonuclease [Chromatiaceae bacterium]|nr:HNH endonuclease [Chromatiaceae bacterium]
MEMVEDKFWDRVVRTDGCWQWKGAKKASGYGKLSPSAGVFLVAHRIAWEIHNGPIPEGLFVCHHCDNPECTNPEHLFLGTPQDNMDDKVRKGRWKGMHPRRTEPLPIKKRRPRVMGRLQPHTAAIVEARNSGETLSEIAARFVCDKSVIRRLLEEQGAYEPIKPGPRKPHNVRSEGLRQKAVEILTRVRNKESLSRIAADLGANRVTLTRIIRNAQKSTILATHDQDF